MNDSTQIIVLEVNVKLGGRKMVEIINQIPWKLIAPILVLQFILMLFAFVSCIKEEKTNGPKWMWVFIILFINLLGPVLYFVLGRRNN